jgi:hypothetical protein
VSPSWWLSTLLLTNSAVERAPIQQPAEPVELVLIWESPATCPDRDRLIDAVRAYLPNLDDPPDQSGRAMLRVHGAVRATDDGWMVELQFTGIDTQMRREFSAASCDDLSEASALIIAVTLDPIATTLALDGTSTPASDEAVLDEVALDEAAPDEPGPERGPAEVEPAPEPVTRGTDDGTRARRDIRRPRVGLRVFGGGGYGPTRTGYPSLGIGLAVFDGRWRAQVDGGWWTPRIRSLVDERAGRVQGFWLGARGCFIPKRDRFEFPLCVGIEAGQIRGRGVSPTRNATTAWLPWLAGSLGAGFGWAPRDRVALGVDAALLVPVIRSSFEIDALTLDAIARVGLRAALFVELRF